VFLILLLLLVGASLEARVPAQAATAAPSDLKQNIANLSALDFPVRMQSARLIRRTPGAEAVPALVEAVRRDANEFVRYRALVLLTGFNDPGTPALMRESMRDRNDRIREVAYKWLERNPDPKLAPALIAALQTEESEFVRPALVSALAALGSDPAVQRAMTGEIGRGLDFFRSAVIDALGRHRAVYAVDGITATSRLEGPLQDDALLALGRIGGTRATAAINEFTGGTQEAIQMQRAARCLIGEMCKEHLSSLVVAASENDARSSAARGAVDALEALAQNRNESALAAIVMLSAGQGALRERMAVAFSSAALRQPDWVVEWISAAPGSTRESAIELLKDGFDSLDESFDEEQFFAAVRAGYWRAADGSGGRSLAATLIQRLEF
jgi:HEAT repeat protein